MKFTIAYTLLFIYIVIAIVFWGYSLHKQNGIIYQSEKEMLEMRSRIHETSAYESELAALQDKRARRDKQYIGEGSFFLLIILLSAGVVYIAYFRQQQLNKLQQNFMLSVTHELKTPIAGIKLNLQTLEKRKLEEKMQQQLMKTAVHEADRLNDLCNNILIATQLENKRKAIYSEEINLNALITDQAEEMKSRYADLKLDLEIDLPEFSFNGEYTLWKMVISNLMENAYKYSGGKPITVSLKAGEKNNTVLSVADLGPGIPDDEKSKVFRKFYRIGNESTRSSKGTGLGLFIVKKITRLYKYDITVKNNQPHGAIFEIKFTA
ncbi:MAG: HAMP domain-containing histidine kinase [Chitinophagaceae bacterium]|nr:HAMP domain-containing histidine kinase [Chitinophagaceae bacterium]